MIELVLVVVVIGVLCAAAGYVAGYAQAAAPLHGRATVRAATEADLAAATDLSGSIIWPATPEQLDRMRRAAADAKAENVALAEAMTALYYAMPAGREHDRPSFVQWCRRRRFRSGSARRGDGS